MSYHTLNDIEMESGRSSANSMGRLSEGVLSVNTLKIEIDKIYIELNDIDKANARIKKNLQRYTQIEADERKETRQIL